MNSRCTLLVRYLLFCLFFTAGAGAIALSILIHPEISTCLRNRQALEQIRRQNEKIRDLTAQIQAQIDLIRSDPNVLARLSRVTFGRTFAESDSTTADLPAGNEALRQAARSVLEEVQTPPADPELPLWYQRCLEPRTRTALFAAGAGLVLITFLFFGSPKMRDPNEESNE